MHFDRSCANYRCGTLFVRSGFTHRRIQMGPWVYTPFGDSGKNGFYWSSISNSNSDRAHYLSFDSSGINLSSMFRYLGFPLRCLAS